MTSENNLQRAVVRSTLINLSLSLSLKFSLFVQSVILARIFLPADIGLFTTVIMTISFVLLLGQFGAEQAIIRHKEKESIFLLMDTALTLGLLVSTILFIAIFVLAPFIAIWTGQPKIGSYIRLLSFFTFGNTLAFPSALWIKNFQFGKAKLPVFADLVASLGTTLLLFYLFDCGIWSLFYGRIGGFLANYGTLWVMTPYRPCLSVDAKLARGMLGFGWPLLVNGLCNYFVWQGDQWLVLYFWGKEQLAYYVLAFSLSCYLRELVDMASATLFPLFSRVQNETNRMANAFSSSNKYLAIMTAPIGIALCIFAPTLIRYVFTEKWLSSVPLLQAFALATTLNVALGYNWGTLVLTSGRTRYLMYTNLWIIFLLCTVGVYMVRHFGPIGGCIFMFIQTCLTALLFRLPIIYSETKSLSFLKEIWKPLLSAVVSGVIIEILVIPFISSPAQLLAAGVGYAGLYILFLILTDRAIIHEARYLSRIGFSFETSHQRGYFQS